MTVTPYFVDADVDDFTAPTFNRVDATVADGSLTLAVDVVDGQGGPDRVKRVRVLVLVDPEHGVAEEWRGLDLVRTEGSRWTGSIPVDGDDIEFVAQAVDAAGNVGVTANKALNFRDEAAVQDPPASSLRLRVAGPEGDAGWYVGPVTFTATGGTSLTVEIAGESDERPYDGPVTVSGEGPHTVIVRSADGQEVARTVRVDSIGPVAVIAVSTSASCSREINEVSVEGLCVAEASPHALSRRSLWRADR